MGADTQVQIFGGRGITKGAMGGNIEMFHVRKQHLRSAISFEARFIDLRLLLQRTYKFDSVINGPKVFVIEGQ
jgi:hypothetical protein